MFRSTVLGQLLKPDDKRDAIHIAVAPVVCVDSNLIPGAHVGFVKGETPSNDEAVSAHAEKKLGIVDPFLRESVKRGERFWMFLYPNTITSLRHDWSHPAFECDVQHSREEIDKMSRIVGIRYERMMAAAAEYLENDEYCHMGDNEDYNGVDFEQFWKHYEIVTGKKVNQDKKYCFFSCAC